jgi:hypothetical protein
LLGGSNMVFPTMRLVGWYSAQHSISGVTETHAKKCQSQGQNPDF